MSADVYRQPRLPSHRTPNSTVHTADGRRGAKARGFAWLPALCVGALVGGCSEPESAAEPGATPVARQSSPGRTEAGPLSGAEPPAVSQTGVRAGADSPAGEEVLASDLNRLLELLGRLRSLEPDPTAVAVAPATWDFDRVAVLVDTRTRVLLREAAGAAGAVEDAFVEELLSRGYRVPERSHVAELLDDLEIGETMAAEKLGLLCHLLGVDGVLFVGIRDLGAPEPQAEPGDPKPSGPDEHAASEERIRRPASEPPGEPGWRADARVSARLVRGADCQVLWQQGCAKTGLGESVQTALHDAMCGASRAVASAFPPAPEVSCTTARGSAAVPGEEKEP